MYYEEYDRVTDYLLYVSYSQLKIWLLVDNRKVRFLLFNVMYAYTVVLSCSSLITSSIYSIFVEYWCIFSDRPISTQNDLRPSAGHLGWSYSVYVKGCLDEHVKEPYE